MSPLTKLFVVLHVVLSLILVAGFVTFVNAIDNSRKAAMDAKAQLDNRTAEAEALRSQLNAAMVRADDNYKGWMAQIEEAKKGSNATAQLIADRDTKIAEITSRMAMASADLTRLSEALKASQDTQGKLQEMMVALRTSNDQAVAQSAQMSMTISELTNKLDVTERQRRMFAEQLEEARNQNTKLGAAVKDMGGNVNAILASSSSGRAGGAPRINGVVREVREIAGKQYATISVGSADSVTKGMEFKVVDRANNNFLGVLTVDTVEMNEATGRLDGPRLADIKPGVEVKTQL